MNDNFDNSFMKNKNEHNDYTAKNTHDDSNIIFYYNKDTDTNDDIKDVNKKMSEEDTGNDVPVSDFKEEQDLKFKTEDTNFVLPESSKTNDIDQKAINEERKVVDNNDQTINHNQNIVNPNSVNGGFDANNVSYFGGNFNNGYPTMMNSMPNPMNGFPNMINMYPNMMGPYPYMMNMYPNMMGPYQNMVNNIPNQINNIPNGYIENSIPNINNENNTANKVESNVSEQKDDNNTIKNTESEDVHTDNNVNNLLNNNSSFELYNSKNPDKSAGGNRLISFRNVTKRYGADSFAASTVALDDISFDINEGELVIFLGHSGAGKTTALNLLGGMDSVTSGRITVGDRDITSYSLDELTEYRKNDIGFIFQSYNLIQNLTVKENIDISTQIKNESVDASIILDKVGLRDKINNYPAELSGGEQQRVAIARAIAKKPKILLCDEPTGALDFKTGNQILSLIQKTCYEERVTTIIITHNQQIVNMANKIICFNSGKVTKVIINKNPMDVRDIEW